jgi:hypothetical protein
MSKRWKNKVEISMCKSFALSNIYLMKWLDDIKQKLWWRGITGKDLAVLTLMPVSFVAIILFLIWGLAQGM